MEKLPSFLVVRTCNGCPFSRESWFHLCCQHPEHEKSETVKQAIPAFCPLRKNPLVVTLEY